MRGSAEGSHLAHVTGDLSIQNVVSYPRWVRITQLFGDELSSELRIMDPKRVT